MAETSARAAKERLLAALHARQQELLDLCVQTVRIPSENPPGDTTAITHFVRDYLAEAGLYVREYAPRADRPNLLATLGPADARPHLVLNSHLDEFPAGAEGWERPPFSGDVAHGRLHGRGASDMRVGLAASLFLARLVVDLELRLPGRLTFSYSSDEESGGTWGTRWLLENVPELHGDGCLIGDQCGTWAIGIGEKGGCWLRLRTHGRASHAAYGTRDSATAWLVRALQIVQSLEDLAAPLPEVLRPIVAGERPVVGAEWGDQAPDILERVTVNVGTLHGGTSINLVADSAVAELDVRLPPGLTSGGVLAVLEERFAAAGVSLPEIDVLASFDPYFTPPDAAIVRATRANSASVLGRPSLPVLRLGATDARFFRAAGIPTVVFGPKAYNMGGPNEYVTLDDLYATARVHAGVMVDFLHEET
jgi:succinyl-diaminopimelate desuccinylase